MIPQRKKFYIAGPMTGIPQFNFPAFDVAAASLRSYGYLVVSPVELDEPSARAAALANETGDPEQYNADTGETWGDLLARDVKLIADEVSAVVALEGWEESKGARLEVFVARTCGKPVYSYEEWLNDPAPGAPLTDDHLIPDWEINDVMHEGVFGGDKFEPVVSIDPASDTAVYSVPFQPITKGQLSDAERALIDKALKFGARYAVEAVKVGPMIDPDVLERLQEADRRMREENPLRASLQDKVNEVVERKIIFGHEHCQPDMSEIEDKLTGHFSEAAEGYELTSEVRVTSETGGQKGRKPQRMDLLPPEALLALSEVYGMGAEKYDDHNYLKGYGWSLSFGALLRHVMAAEKGEWLDDESGLPHVMHAAWHCFALFMFEKHGLGTDDRISTAVEGVRS